MKEAYGPNKLCALANDNALRPCLESGLAMLLPSKKAELLPATQRRYVVPLDSLDEQLQATADGRKLRLCVEDLLSK